MCTYVCFGITFIHSVLRKISLVLCVTKTDTTRKRSLRVTMGTECDSAPGFSISNDLEIHDGMSEVNKVIHCLLPH